MWNIYEITISFNCDECGWFFSMGFLPYKDQKLWWQEARKFAAGNTIYRKRERARIFFFFLKWLWIKLCPSALYKYFVIFPCDENNMMHILFCNLWIEDTWNNLHFQNIAALYKCLFLSPLYFLNCVYVCVSSKLWSFFPICANYCTTCLLSLKIQKLYLYESGCYIFC